MIYLYKKIMLAYKNLKIKIQIQIQILDPKTQKMLPKTLK